MGFVGRGLRTIQPAFIQDETASVTGQCSTSLIAARVMAYNKPVLSFLRRRKESHVAPYLVNPGHCPVCARDVVFSSPDAWLRDHYLCSNCGSIPRERALMTVIESFFPTWRELAIHESSPSQRGASKRLSEEAPKYFASQKFSNAVRGSMVDNVRCEDLEALTLSDDSVDLHVTQDVFEHVVHPARAFKEIARTLKPGGAHIFTVPLVNKSNPSAVRVIEDGEGREVHVLPAVYHGNPISDEGSIVTVDWGYDICQAIMEACGLFTHMIHIDDLTKGIRAEYIEVLVTVRPR